MLYILLPCPWGGTHKQLKSKARRGHMPYHRQISKLLEVSAKIKALIHQENLK